MMYMWKRRRNFAGQESVLPMGLLGVVLKYPSVGGGVTSMVSLPLFDAAMTSD